MRVRVRVYLTDGNSNRRGMQSILFREPEMIEPARPLRTLAAITLLMRSKFPPESEAWQDFVAECQIRFKTRSELGAEERIVPESIWDYWTAVATGDHADYHPEGARKTGR